MMEVWTFPHLADFHGRGEWLWVLPEDVAKVDVEEASIRGKHQVVQVAVAHTQDLSQEREKRMSGCAWEQGKADGLDMDHFKT